MTWEERTPEEVTCVRCLEFKERRDLDRLLWCDDCCDAARRWAASRGWAVGAGLAVVLSLWIWLVIRPSDLVIGGWIGTVLAALYVSARVAREILYGATRFGKRSAVKAVPPTRNEH